MSATQDYQAAELLLRRPARPGELVVGDKIKPKWIDGGARFWYGVSTGAGKRFVLVDPVAGTREPAFDHARLAAALAAASGQPVDPEALPFRAIEPAGNAVEFDAFGEHWRCRLDSYACERAEFTPPGNPLEVPSPDRKVSLGRRAVWAPARRTRPLGRAAAAGAFDDLDCAAPAAQRASSSQAGDRRADDGDSYTVTPQVPLHRFRKRPATQHGPSACPPIAGRRRTRPRPVVRPRRARCWRCGGTRCRGRTSP